MKRKRYTYMYIYLYIHILTWIRYLCVCVFMEFEMDLETDEIILKFFRMNNMEILRQVEKQKKDTLFAMEHSLA